MTIEITDPHRIATVNHFGARQGQTAEEYVQYAIESLIEADVHCYGKFIPSKEILENRSEQAAA